MSVAKQIERLQTVRNQIRTKMVALGLSEKTDLLQDLASDLDGVAKITPTSSTTDPGTSYTNTTLDRSTDTRYVKIPKGYNGTDTKFTVSGVPDGAYSASVSSHSVTTNPTASSSVAGSITQVTTSTAPASGTDGTDYYTITPELNTKAGTSAATAKAAISTAGYIPSEYKTTSDSISVGVSESQGKDYYLPASTFGDITTTNPTSSTNLKSVTPGTDAKYIPVSAGYRSAGKITVNAIPNQKDKDSVSVTATAGISNVTSIDTTQATSGVTVTATADSTASVALGYYSSAVSKDATQSSKSTTIKPVLASSLSRINPTPTTLPEGTVSITPQTDNAERFFKSSKNGFLTGVVIKPMSNGAYSASISSHSVTAEPTASSSVSGSITDIASKTKPSSGTDKVDYYTITPSLSTEGGKVKAVGKATISTSGYLAADSKTDESSIPVAVSPSPGDSYYLSATTYTDKGTTDPGTSYTNKLTISPSGTDPKYIQITKGYTPNSKITISKMSAGAFSSVTTTDPGTDYSNNATVTPSTKTKYVAVSAGYLPNSKITINAMANGSVSEATTTDPGDSYNNRATVTPSTSTQYVKISAGYLSNGKIKVNAVPSTATILTTSGWSSTTTSPELGGYTQVVTVTGVTASNHVIVIPSSDAGKTAARTYGVYAYSQAKDSLTFRAFDKPTSSITYIVYYFS